MLCREFDDVTDDYSPTQMKIINSTLAITADNWHTTKTALGRIMYLDPVSATLVEGYGVNAEVLVGKIILGENLVISNKNNNAIIDEDGFRIFNDKNTVTINPNSTNIFEICKGEQKQLYIDENGNLQVNASVTVEGKITAEQILIDDLSELNNSKIAGWSINSSSISKTCTISGDTYTTSISSTSSSTGTPFSIKKVSNGTTTRSEERRVGKEC